MKIIADVNIPFVKECFSSVGDVELMSGREISKEMLKDAQVLLVRSVTKVGPQLLEGTDVKFVATATIGLDHIDLPWLGQNNIGFASAPGSNANSVAEYITAAMFEIAAKQKRNLHDCSLGIIGVGNVGSRVEAKASSLGMDVVLNDPPLARQSQDSKYRPIEEALNCDFVTLHTPLTCNGQDATRHLAGHSFFSQIKQDVVFMNTSRGAVMNTSAVTDAVKSGKVSGLVLDVWENEPDIDMSILELTDVASPHIAGYSFDGKVAGMTMIYDACCQYFGIEPKYKAVDFLPEPSVPVLDVSGIKGTEEEVINHVVNAVYRIMEDDADIRQMLEKGANERPVYFDTLRKNYSIRREFMNTLITGANGSLASKLAGIGFKLE